jgi:hypothetical protein
VTDAVFMDFEEPGGGRMGTHPWDGAPQGGKKRGKKRGRREEEPPEQKEVAIPRLPSPEPMLTGDEVRRGVSDRNRAAAKLKIKGHSYLEIADIMEFDSAQDAKRAVESVIAATLSPEEIEMTRAVVIARAEEQFRQSVAMGHADYLVDDDGNRIPNERKLQWHQQASNDLLMIATLTGAKAPTKVEFTPGEAELERIVNAIVLRSGHEDIMDAEVIQLDEIPAIEAGEDDGEIYG